MKKNLIYMIAMLFCIATYAQTNATYDIVFTSNWEAHGPLPGSNAHFSDLVGVTHNNAITFLEMGGISDQGIEQIAETGETSGFENNVANAITSNSANQFFNGGSLFFNGTRRTIAINDLAVTKNHPLVTMASMIAPSPDWMIALNNLSSIKTFLPDSYKLFDI